MSHQLELAVIAIVAGAVVGVGLFVPFVAISYRRRGGLTLGRVVLWAGALVYFWAIWSYTLLPLPDPDTMRCVGVNLQLFALVDDVRGAVIRPGNTITDPVVLQLLLNVLLLVPLGFILRVLGGRGILVAGLVGLTLSAFIETTQLTGVWGIYRCAYRVLDVDDLVTNTSGALLGSILAWLVPRRHRGFGVVASAGRPRPVTRPRRLLAMVCDLLGVLVLGTVLMVGTQAVLEFIAGNHAAVIDGTIATVVGNAVPLVAWLVCVLVTGRTVGDLAVQLRYEGGRVPAWLARPLRFIGGVGGWMLLDLVPGAGAWAAAAAAITGFVLVLTPVGPRGLPGLVSGQRLGDARATVAVR